MVRKRLGLAALVAAVALDLTIRHATESRRTLGELLPHLYARFPHMGSSRGEGRTIAPLTNSQLIEEVATLYGPEVGDGLRRFVLTSERIDLAPILERAGLAVEGRLNGRSVIVKMPERSEAQQLLFRSWVGGGEATTVP